jgi:hypothetical protein
MIFGAAARGEAVQREEPAFKQNVEKTPSLVAGTIYIQMLNSP